MALAVFCTSPFPFGWLLNFFIYLYKETRAISVSTLVHLAVERTLFQLISTGTAPTAVYIAPCSSSSPGSILSTVYSTTQQLCAVSAALKHPMAQLRVW